MFLQLQFQKRDQPVGRHYMDMDYMGPQKK